MNKPSPTSGYSAARTIGDFSKLRALLDQHLVHGLGELTNTRSRVSSRTRPTS